MLAVLHNVLQFRKVTYFPDYWAADCVCPSRMGENISADQLWNDMGKPFQEQGFVNCWKLVIG